MFERSQPLDVYRDLTLAVLDSCQLVQTICLEDVNQTLTLHVPAGDMKYDSFWVRDAAMMASSGLISASVLAGWLRLIACAGQNGDHERLLEHQLKIPAWAIADHINYDGRPVFFPGTYSSGQDQGNGRCGFYPPQDDASYFIDIANQYLKQGGSASYFSTRMNGLTLLDRLERAFQSIQIDPHTQLCISSLPEYAVDWGFCDVIVKSGLLLFPSILRYQAARQLQQIIQVVQNVRSETKAAFYADLAAKIQQSVKKQFADPSGSGWLLSATEVGRQKDVWGTAFAIWTGILDGELQTAALRAIRQAYLDGSAVSYGYVRHILEGDDAHPGTSAWQQTSCPYNTYQNGGFWATPTGWFAYALAQADPDLAARMLNAFYQDWQAKEAQGAPYEWRSRDGSVVDGKRYGASAALPYAALTRLRTEHLI